MLRKPGLLSVLVPSHHIFTTDVDHIHTPVQPVADEAEEFVRTSALPHTGPWKSDPEAQAL